MRHPMIHELTVNRQQKAIILNDYLGWLGLMTKSIKASIKFYMWGSSNNSCICCRFLRGSIKTIAKCEK